jgi:hypothetical protein
MAKKLPLDELSGAIGRIRRLLLTGEKVDAAVEVLARAIKDSVPGTIGAGVSMLDPQGRRTSYAATDRVVEQADALQYELGEGPCLTAWGAEESERDLVNRACGILMQRHGIGHEEALADLMEQARRSHTTLAQAGNDLIAGLPADRN